jgi:hypothetical protein
MESRLTERRNRAAEVSGVVAIGVLSALTIIGRMSDPAHHKWLALDIAVGIVACGLWLGLRRHPIPTAIALAVLAVSRAATPPSTAATLTIALRFPLRTALLAHDAGLA